jgi:hypothetical protein
MLKPSLFFSGGGLTSIIETGNMSCVCILVAFFGKTIWTWEGDTPYCSSDSLPPWIDSFIAPPAFGLNALCYLISLKSLFDDSYPSAGDISTDLVYESFDFLRFN